MSGRTALVVALAVLVVGLALALLLGTPWHPLPVRADRVPVNPHADFTAGEIARAKAYHAALRFPAYGSLVLTLVITVLLGLSPLGARLVDLVSRPLGGGWGWRVLLGGIAVTAVGRLLVLPLDAWSESVRRRYGLSTQHWGSWLVDVAKAYGVGLVITLVVLFSVFALIRWSPEWWWTWGAAAGALLVVAVSFAYPVVIEPVFNKFTPLQDGPLRTSLLQMAERDGVPAKDVLVADASRRTTALNAYVSGFGATRRIVVYDTLVTKASPDEVRLVVAHELGHAKRRDVLLGTLLGALGSATLVCALALAMRSGGLLRRSGVDEAGDPRALALVLAIVAVIAAIGGPVQVLASRRIETRADVHALDLTRDPQTFVEMQQRLSVTNLSDPDPSTLAFGLFATHPTGPQRIALARDWARLHGVTSPPPLVH